MEFKESIPFLNDGTWEYIHSIDDVSVETAHLRIEIIDSDLLKKKMLRINWEET